MSIFNAIERARREPPLASPDGIFPEQCYVCKVFDPLPWNQVELEHILGFEIPPELSELWHVCGGLILYEDDMFCQWGLVICPPVDTDMFMDDDASFSQLNSDYLKRKGDRALPGDLIIARFWGDLELVLIRCDKSAADYGSIVIVTEMGPRDDWYKAASSLEEFLTKFMDAHGAKYWEYHYQKALAEKAAQQAQGNE